MRFVSAAIFFAVAAFVYWYNGRGGDDVLVFPFIAKLWPAAEGDPGKLSQGTIGLILGVGVVLFVKDAVRTVLRRRSTDDPAA
jgi:hypothetical protein